jgi:YesN/AraC family two-component response regulator
VTTLHYILVADDDAMIRRFLVRVVSKVAPHLQIIEATDGAQALNILQTTSLVAVITDYHMPSVTGLQIVETAHAQNPGLPVIVVSAHTEVAAAVLAAGATHFLSKPITIERLTAALHAILPTP